ncbi:hypothetical protein [Methylobacterium thuringiense]|uniref:Uncharacterized protein n=1 Tax=Methylobacterium thuringiense TaxID=1003091 RepID=A0ABQ4THY8_9HYPH|nr:hypothetical protein [Methylobacterium thuringiense]GJE54886.1 hypothetical protein EKPJFOCH_1371 [Methylobacterium thuringiense]
MNKRNATPRPNPAPFRLAEQPRFGRRHPSVLARDRSRRGIAADPVTAASDFPDDEEASLTGLLDEEFDADDASVSLRTTMAVALRLLHEEDDDARFC